MSKDTIILKGTDRFSVTFSSTGDILSFSNGTHKWELPEKNSGCSLRLSTKDNSEKISINFDSTNNRLIKFDEQSIQVKLEQDTAKIHVKWFVKNNLLQAEIEVLEVAQDYILDEVVIPDLKIPVSAKGKLIWPCQSSGYIFEEAGNSLLNKKDVLWEFEYPACTSMQCLGWTEDKQGIYFDSKDPKGYSKFWELEKAEGKFAQIKLRHPVPRTNDNAKNYKLPYPISIAAFSGNWYQFSQIYRKWALPVFDLKCKKKTTQTEKFEDIACWLWNRGNEAHVCPPAIEFMERLERPVGLNWYWWHKHAYDSYYPDYFPPREGEDNFRKAVSELKSKGIFTQVYTNGVAFDMDSGNWLPDGPQCAILQENGDYKAHVFNSYLENRLAFCCGGSDLWQKKVKEFVHKIHDLGLDAIYIDMIANSTGYPNCFNPHHQHAPGGGCYHMDGFKKMLAELRGELKDFILTSEGTHECYINSFDGGIDMGPSMERMGGAYEFRQTGSTTTKIPLWDAVFHGSIINYGNYALIDGIPPYDELWPQEFKTPSDQELNWHELCPDQFALETARTVIYGHQPMAANFQMKHLRNKCFENDVAWLIKLSRFYHDNRKWLLKGRLLEPGKLEFNPIQVKLLTRSLFTKPGLQNIFAKQMSPVLHSEWQSPEGEKYLLLINFSRQSQEIKYTPAKGLKLESNKTSIIPARDIVKLNLK